MSQTQPCHENSSIVSFPMIFRGHWIQDPMLHARQNRRWSRDTQARNQRPLLRLPPTEGQAFFQKAPHRTKLHSQTGANAGGYVSGQCQLPKKVQFQKKSPPQKKRKKEDSHRHQTRNIVSLLAYARNNARKWIPIPRSPKKNKKFPSFCCMMLPRPLVGLFAELFFFLLSAV